MTILSDPNVFHAAVRTAMLQYKCTAESGEFTATWNGLSFDDLE
jgi:hypothetical protein